MTKLTREEVHELRRMEKLAEFGPWEVGRGMHLNGLHVADFGVDVGDDQEVHLHSLNPQNGEGALQDALFVAAIRNRVEALLDAAEWALEHGYDDQTMLRNA